ncbi:MAG TPA: Slp family lipoprotein [Tahibacter sp.]|uniref:Slp family lipoprotein n=1 Tax=Tahibacter sp. TaxID=2056211 RepID=UPI002D15089B|nr:Slp family lipoprotein [Tahibacter sp.]HSX62043.1 Slp family lipoprotein [Tahibacter sp.]
MSFIRLSLTTALLALAGCATAPKPLQGEFAAAAPDAVADGQKVRWGGEIIRVDNAADRSCFEVLARPLDGSARPLRRDRSDGRFLACRSGFYDPAVFEPGREITVTGTIAGSELRKVGDYDYRYTRVAADVIYLWNEREALAYPSPWFYDPFWYRPWWGPSFVVIHHRHERRKN